MAPVTPIILTERLLQGVASWRTQCRDAGIIADLFGKFRNDGWNRFPVSK